MFVIEYQTKGSFAGDKIARPVLMAVPGEGVGRLHCKLSGINTLLLSECYLYNLYMKFVSEVCESISNFRPSLYNSVNFLLYGQIQ